MNRGLKWYRAGLLNYYHLRHLISRQDDVLDEIPSFQGDHVDWLGAVATLFSSQRQMISTQGCINDEADSYFKQFYAASESEKYTIFALSNSLYSIFVYKMMVVDCFCLKHRGSKLICGNADASDHSFNCIYYRYFAESMRQYLTLKKKSKYWGIQQKKNRKDECKFWNDEIKYLYFDFTGAILDVCDNHCRQNASLKGRDRKSLQDYLADNLESFEKKGRILSIALHLIKTNKVNPNTSKNEFDILMANETNIAAGQAYIDRLVKVSGDLIDFHEHFGNFLRHVVETGAPSATIKLKCENPLYMNLKYIKYINKNWQSMQRTEHKGKGLIAPTCNNDEKTDAENDSDNSKSGSTTDDSIRRSGRIQQMNSVLCVM